jgi:hypothetical protein
MTLKGRSDSTSETVRESDGKAASDLLAATLRLSEGQPDGEKTSHPPV